METWLWVAAANGAIAAAYVVIAAAIVVPLTVHGELRTSRLGLAVGSLWMSVVTLPKAPAP